MIKKHKILIGIAVVGAVMVGLSIALTAGAVTLGFVSSFQRLPYNSDLSQMELPLNNIRFARSDCGSFDFQCNLDIYEINADGTSLKQVSSTDASKWPPPETQKQMENNMISNGCGGSYDGIAQIGNKKIEINRNLIRTQMILTNGNEKIILEEKEGLSPDFGFGSLMWMPDGRHLLITDQTMRNIGIYDTETRKYAHLAEGYHPVPSNADSSF